MKIEMKCLRIVFLTFALANVPSALAQEARDARSIVGTTTQDWQVQVPGISIGSAILS
jgi:hypothetical protein